jgi:transcription elongation GreA/GreB family factor
MVNKPVLIELIRKSLEQELAALIQAAQATHEAATHEESKAEDSHDTRGIELSYLAGAQASRAADLQRMLQYFRKIDLKGFEKTDGIAPTALVELSVQGKKSLYFLALQGGGVRVTVEGMAVQVITPASPVGEEMIGRRIGDSIEVEAQGTLREYLITAIA